MGLFLNLDRQRVRKVADQLQAEVLKSGGEVPDEWFQLLTDSPEEAANLRRSHRLAEAKAQVNRP